MHCGQIFIEENTKNVFQFDQFWKTNRMTEFKDLVFHHHTSLGDNFICNGIVHYYAENLCDTLHIPCHQKYFETIDCLYKDFDNIIVHPFNDDWATLEREMFQWAQEKQW